MNDLGQQCRSGYIARRLVCAGHVEVGHITFAPVDKALGARQRRGPMGGAWGPHVIKR